jgi:hypothetical protein
MRQVARPRADRYIAFHGRPSSAKGRVCSMRAETEKLVEDIKQSVGLLRRHL